MRSYLVLLDGTPASWEAAYAAFHLAARLASRLVGMAGRDPAGERAARQWLAEFETGGRAAGISVESRLVTRLDPGLILDQTESDDGVFIGRRGDEPVDMLTALYDNLASPLWIVPRQVSIRHIACLGGVEVGDTTDRFAHSLSRRLGAELSSLGAEPGRQAKPANAVEQVLARLVEARADLVVLDRSQPAWPARQLCLQPPCQVVGLRP